MNKLENMSIEQLEARNQELMQQRAEISKQQRELSVVLDQRRAEEALAKDVEALKAKHNVQTIKVEGIPSAEQVGEQ